MVSLAQVEDRANAAYDLAVRNQATTDAHLENCELQGARTEEKIDALSKKFDFQFENLKETFQEWREADTLERARRQAEVDEKFKAIEERNRRVQIAILTAAITFISLTLGVVFKPFGIAIGEFLKALL